MDIFVSILQNWKTFAPLNLLRTRCHVECARKVARWYYDWAAKSDWFCYEFLKGSKTALNREKASVAISKPVLFFFYFVL